jgi:hypothetical protein
MQQDDRNFYAFGARPGHGKTRWRPQDAADGGDRVAEGRLVFKAQRLPANATGSITASDNQRKNPL